MSGSITTRRTASRPLTPLPETPLLRPLRLQLSAEIGCGSMDGAWWPYGHDLSIEVLDLVRRFPPVLGRLSRILYSAPDWRVNRRRRIQADDASVIVGPFARDDAHMVMLRSVSPRVSRVLQLLVVPPEWGGRAARCAMLAAVSTSNTASGAVILDRARDR